jgi:uncharacterized repeat protein (TIGR03803 family)
MRLIALAGFAAMLGAVDAATSAPLSTLYTFCAQTNCEDGQGPLGHPVLDGAGNLYGTTQNGGDFDSNAGTVWQLARQGSGSWSFKTIYTFCALANCTDGAYPRSGLTADTAGNLYGITGGGGAYNRGVIYELKPNGDKRPWKLKVLYSFCADQQSCQDGELPFSDLSYAGSASGTPYDGMSPLYGTTELGGTNGYGTVFRLSSKNGRWKYSVLYSFCAQPSCSDGSYPSFTPVVDLAGNVYGTTGGVSGVVYKLSSTDQKIWTETVVYAFCQQPNCIDGLAPGPLTMDTAGNLVGATVSGGSGASCPSGFSGGCGTIFRISLNRKHPKETVLYSFCQSPDCADGVVPTSIQLDSSGTIFGDTFYGGGNDQDQYGDGGGTIFQLKGKNYKVLHAFCSKSDCSDGEYPLASLAIGSDGRLFGVTPDGGRGALSTAGTVFELSPRFATLPAR